MSRQNSPGTTGDEAEQTPHQNRFLRDRFAFVIDMSARVVTMRETAQNKLSQDEEERNCQAEYYVLDWGKTIV